MGSQISCECLIFFVNKLMYKQFKRQHFITPSSEPFFVFFLLCAVIYDLTRNFIVHTTIILRKYEQICQVAKKPLINLGFVVV
jgi:hypothetical protein